MEKLESKLKEIQELLKQDNPSLKVPKPPKPVKPETLAKPQAPKAMSPQSKKDPKKVAEQLKDPASKDDALKQAKKLKEGVKFTKSGQWYLEKEELDKVFPVPSTP